MAERASTAHSQPPPDQTPGRILVFSAPSGAGKTTLLDGLREEIPGLVYSISATTRAPRQGERDGEHYFFMDREEFQRRIEREEFAEWAEVHGNLYGTPRELVDRTIAAGSHLVMDIDVQGKVQFDRFYPKALGVLILPPSMEILEERLRARGTDSDETIALRLRNARREIEFAQSKGRYEHTIVNDSLPRARAEIVGLVRDFIERPADDH